MTDNRIQELEAALLAAHADAEAAVALALEEADLAVQAVSDNCETDGERLAIMAAVSAIRARAPEDAIAEVAKLREEVKHKNGVIARLLTEAGHLDHARNNEQAMAVEAASERDRLAAELAAANAREAGLREALDMSHQGWRNALELDLLPKQHRHSAKTMADIAAAALASRPTEYEQKVAKMKEDFPNGI